MEIPYPQYRKYKNNKSYFKIIAADAFEEIQILPSGNKLFLFKAKILPDRNYIADLTNNYDNFADEISEQEYEKIKLTVI